MGLRIEIRRSADLPDGRKVVHFSSEYGTVLAIWRGTTAVGDVHDVELDAAASLTWGSDIVPATEPGARIALSGDDVVIRATLESDDEDGIVTLRSGADSIIQLETLGDVPPAGTVVEAYIHTLEIWDTSI